MGAFKRSFDENSAGKQRSLECVAGILSPEKNGQTEFIEVKNISKAYRIGEVEIHAVRDVSFSVKKGELVVVGPSSVGISIYFASKRHDVDNDAIPG